MLCSFPPLPVPAMLVHQSASHSSLPYFFPYEEYIPAVGQQQQGLCSAQDWWFLH